jgi:hypothetical protein
MKLTQNHVQWRSLILAVLKLRVHHREVCYCLHMLSPGCSGIHHAVNVSRRLYDLLKISTIELSEI